MMEESLCFHRSPVRHKASKLVHVAYFTQAEAQMDMVVHGGGLQCFTVSRVEAGVADVFPSLEQLADAQLSL